MPRSLSNHHRIERIAPGKTISDVLQLIERFSRPSAFAHSLAYCQAVEEICSIEVPRRAKALRIIVSELERLRHHVTAIRSICASTAVSPAADRARNIERALLRVSRMLTGHRHFLGLNAPGGLKRDFTPEAILEKLAGVSYDVRKDLKKLQFMLKFSSRFLEHLIGIGTVSSLQAASYGLVGPVARASGILGDVRKTLPYSGYELIEFSVPTEAKGDGYARLNVLFHEADQSARIIQDTAMVLPVGEVLSRSFKTVPGASLGCVEAPGGAAFHWLTCGDDGRITGCRLTTPSFTNWLGLLMASKDASAEHLSIIKATFAE